MGQVAVYSGVERRCRAARNSVGGMHTECHHRAGGASPRCVHGQTNTWRRNLLVPSPAWPESSALTFADASLVLCLRRVASRTPGASSLSLPTSIALEAVRRLYALFDIEHASNGKPAPHRLAVRQNLSELLMIELPAWLAAQRAALSRNHVLTKVINDMLRRWDAFVRFLDDGQVYLSNDAAERPAPCTLGQKGVAVLRLRSRRRMRRDPLHAHPDRPQRYLFASLARRHPRSHCRSPR